MDALPSLPNLTPDDRFWRLDWFGECAYPGSVRREAQPSIKVALSPLRGDPSDIATPLLPDSTDHQHQHEAWLPVAALPLLSIGDIWHQGQRFASPDCQVESFKRLHIAPDTTSFVKAGLAIDGHFMLPLSRHPWHRHHTHSYCVAVSLDEHRRLLVPCVELIRFYFGSSSNFIQRLFTAPLAPEALWASKHFDPENKHLHLVLARRLSGASASDIGRISESRFAWRAAAGIYTSCQKATVLQHPAYPYTGFPFEGTTNLVASGVWLPFGEQENATFLAYRLRSCSYPFPFHSLSYEAADRKVWHDGVGSNKTGSGKFSRERTKTKSEVVDADPGANKAQRMSFFRSQHRFPDLVWKQVWREKIEAMPKADVFLRRADGSFEQVAFGENYSHSNVAGLNAAEGQAEISNSEKEISPPHFVKVGLKAIASIPEYALPSAQIKLVCLPGKTNPVFNLPMVIDEDGEISNDLLFCNADGGTRQRRGCFVEVNSPTKTVRFFLISEGQSSSAPPEVILVGEAEMTTDMLREILNFLVK